ncbi:hypothetical protein BDV27DRAFT_156128 [Aspergillus caelatus]|uniref:DUF7702 domain-containing protein n=1 Tax=Aspergillus caelatus TaxID=61420 RepID=A0A5N7A8V9_9EURO|nr:uncharacterized protein BDV27DRAFT_156128 [Aspergillus caelatus]KAE8366272.1 hypothetical protein BDV27DRAFT_156128 [Aspergillus caelatus]
MTTSTKSLELAQLAFYGIAAIPAIYCFIAHRKHGKLGWLYVFVMCGLRLVGNGMLYHALSTTGQPSTPASIISGIGLSPLLLAALGILRESNHSIQSSLPAILGPFGLLIPHLVVTGGIGLAASSGKNFHLLEVGLIIFATGWFIVLGLIIASAKANSHHRRVDDEKKLLLAVKIAVPLIGVRIVYAIVIAFKYQNISGGSLAVKVVFGILPEFLVMISYLSAGLITRHLDRDRVQKRPQPDSNTAYTCV